MNNNNILTELTVDEWIWIIFIILSILNIYGDYVKKEGIIYNDYQKGISTKKIFTFTVFISLIIYIYITNIKYQNIKVVKFQNQDPRLHQLRLLGSIFIVVGVFLLLYFQINSPTSNNPSVI